MAEPTGHCPYLGLKQNRAIRFASPTAEHRCYISGEPLEIPVDQTTYCLSQGHLQCPLYMGLTVPTTATPDDTIAAAGTAGGLAGWYGSLSPRDRLVYTLMLAMLAAIVGIYLLVGLQSVLNNSSARPTVVAALPTSAATGAAAAPSAQPTDALPTPTNLPSSTPEPQPTDAPTSVPIILPPTGVASAVPTNAPSAAPAPTQQPSAAPAPTQQPSSTARPTAAPQTQPTKPPAPKPTQAPAPKPTQAPAATQAPAPTAVPAAQVSTEDITLYFSDPSGTVLVPVHRNTRVENNRVATAAVNELIAGPRNGLARMVSAEARLLDLRIEDKRAIANFDRDPGGYDSIVFTLTEFTSISSVQIQVNGANLGGARGRPVLNPLNPQNLATDYAATEFLPLYFPSATSNHDIRLIRMVPKTKQTAQATVQALLDGPGTYNGIVRRVLPEGTQLRGIKLNGDVALVDFTEPFARAADLDAAMRTVVESLTTLKTVRGVQFLVEGNPFADGKIFHRPTINQE